jgi:hypothetical protein
MKMNNKNLFGIIFSVIISIVFVISIVCWFNLYKEPKITVKQIKENEINTYLNLKKIANAQQKYIKEDWDGDGKYEYSKFLVHLWKTVTSKNGDTKLLGFISKELGFASEPSFAINGYSFTPLYYYVVPDKPLERIDYTKEWAVFANPSEGKRSGNLYFLIDQTGNIVVSETHVVYNNEYPFLPLQNNWKLISSLDDLKKLQENLVYIVL